MLHDDTKTGITLAYFKGYAEGVHGIPFFVNFRIFRVLHRIMSVGFPVKIFFHGRFVWAGGRGQE